MPKSQKSASDNLHLQADVLVLGGGPSAAWAAVAAAESGARVALADKGYLGTSGATAPSNTGTWCVPPGDNRHAVVERRWQRTGELADQRWMLRCVDTAYRNLLRLSEWGYPFPSEDDGRLYIANLRGPDYMRFMRRRVLLAGVTVLDHHPALELLSDGDAIVGAGGVARQAGHDWRVDAKAVVLATGGCAFRERILGGTGLTGDGYLMAAEAGASLSGMEFTGKYTLAPYGSSLNKGLPFRWASFHREDGSPILGPTGEPLRNGIGDREDEVARALIDGPVYARLDQAEPALQGWLRQGQPNCFVPYDRAGIDPFIDLFRITLRAEGTVRGTGGIDIVSDDCATGVPGLYVAGDAASREIMTGAVSGGGAVNSSWALASGWWAGKGASTHAKRRAGKAFRSTVQPLGQAGLRPAATPRADIAAGEVIEAVRNEVTPLDKNFFRSGAGLERSSERLESVWRAVRDHLRGEGADKVRAREAASIAAAGRWSVASALHRTESRGMHRRTDLPGKSPALARRLIITGVDAFRIEGTPERPAELAS
ncbi:MULTISPECIES: FAD-binding protein [unclassified Mesorhizobium]|uniref:FAD-dependent oxidoreductase n=1 Tax=unclassified Mesorhizobium TaxID=325217 RepID=UPI000FD8B48A|nr:MULTISPECIES: FAD-binding protein [unclassified Mesorhizobium]TGR37695.1 FAD-binding protein [bacterium M00.F.Ca.ET.199.01.1.1]TGU22676.1 FAD-binding protein [bacterium M00.F.Ca.ET.156.01.1.1]TGV82886.1 FAD-binding protein [Mesorhizobium sp. M00.F.Ca.ET.149.01.1.1]TGR17778.1 FAD-binding protein [Mesorhizobium sp. M8A.F.Ca.ET.202.01.1.1]TGR19778.1 FAD-binding protein [Mesorhizobium sp. M8A.F.Ca.ET.197.01.1.1]